MMTFDKLYELRGSDFDCYDRIRPASVLDLFQDVAGIHAQRLNIGADTLLERNIIWVLTKARYRLVGIPHRYESVRVHTWPLPPSRVNCRREYLIETVDGQPLVQGCSDWVLVHSEKRRVLPAGDLYPAGEDYCQETFFPGRLAKVPAFVPQGEGLTVTPSFTQLDINGHVNNTRYADYVMDALCPEKAMSVKELQIDYHRELLCGVPVQLYVQRDGESVLARGISGTGECMFSCCLSVEG